MDSNRKSFEAEYSKVMGTPITVLRNLRDGECYRETEGDRLSLSWVMWKQSRSAIEIELPDGEIQLTTGRGQKVMMPAHDVVKAITSHGIRIKGKTE